VECGVCKQNKHRICIENELIAEDWANKEDARWILKAFGTSVEQMMASHYQDGAEIGNIKAMHALGLICIRNGNIEKAREWLSKVEQQRQIRHTHYLRAVHRLHQIAPSTQWTEKQIRELNYKGEVEPWAKYVLACILEVGSADVPQDRERAYRLHAQAVQAGFRGSLWHLVEMNHLWKVWTCQECKGADTTHAQTCSKRYHISPMTHMTVPDVRTLNSEGKRIPQLLVKSGDIIWCENCEFVNAAELGEQLDRRWGEKQWTQDTGVGTVEAETGTPLVKQKRLSAFAERRELLHQLLDKCWDPELTRSQCIHSEENETCEQCAMSEEMTRHLELDKSDERMDRMDSPDNLGEAEEDDVRPVEANLPSAIDVEGSQPHNDEQETGGVVSQGVLRENFRQQGSREEDRAALAVVESESPSPDVVTPSGGPEGSSIKPMKLGIEEETGMEEGQRQHRTVQQGQQGREQRSQMEDVWKDTWTQPFEPARVRRNLLHCLAQSAWAKRRKDPNASRIVLNTTRAPHIASLPLVELEDTIRLFNLNQTKWKRPIWVEIQGRPVNFARPFPPGIETRMWTGPWLRVLTNLGKIRKILQESFTMSTMAAMEDQNSDREGVERALEIVAGSLQAVLLTRIEVTPDGEHWQTHKEMVGRLGSRHALSIYERNRVVMEAALRSVELWGPAIQMAAVERMENMTPSYCCIHHEFDQFDHILMGEERRLSAVGNHRERAGEDNSAAVSKKRKEQQKSGKGRTMVPKKQKTQSRKERQAENKKKGRQATEPGSQEAERADRE